MNRQAVHVDLQILAASQFVTPFALFCEKEAGIAESTPLPQACELFATQPVSTLTQAIRFAYADNAIMAPSP